MADDRSIVRRLYENVMGTPEQNAAAEKRMAEREAKKEAPKKAGAALGAEAIGKKAGGKVKSASARADGCACRGKTKGRMV